MTPTTLTKMPLFAFHRKIYRKRNRDRDNEWRVGRGRGVKVKRNRRNGCLGDKERNVGSGIEEKTEEVAQGEEMEVWRQTNTNT